MARSKQGHRGWSRGLTAATDPRVAKSAATARGRRRGPYRTQTGFLAGECPVLPIGVDRQSDYAYVLGMYLGDGHLARLRRTWVLRIYLDATQPEIVNRCAHALSRLNPFHRVGRNDRDSMTIVRSNGRCWLRLIPQHGPGRKHLRVIKLEPWQTDVIKRVPMSFLRGLVESDGCRFDRIVGGKAYPAYNFTNHSADILELFCWACQLLGVRFTRPTKYVVSIARRDDVARLDAEIGPKR
jgi:hypothetical protein